MRVSTDVRVEVGGLAGTSGSMTRTARALFCSLLAAFSLAIAPSIASADLLPANPITDWSTLLPGLAPAYNPNDPNLCNSGKPQCIDAVAKEMTKRFQPLSDSCSHNALFSLLYLRVTNHVGDAVRTPGEFDDPGFISHEDAVFASYYFNAFDSYAKGDLAHTPAAWRIAFDAAKNHQVQGIGNLLLGMNAHINRDLPYVLYSIGLVAPDGSSRKPDHDRINAVLYDAYNQAIGEGAQRFDPSLQADTGPTAADTGIQSVIMWREEAWRNAVRLASAASDAERAVISQQIDQAAEAEAQVIKAAYSYDGVVNKSSDRDAYCAVHHNDGT
ncbi:MAG: hypothetical protein QOC55_1500 [Thermoleophilaceae bacterium]|nr:hypothetical protein [Thermoleophilaceae bacterium]